MYVDNEVWRIKNVSVQVDQFMHFYYYIVDS